ncbi:hypothetical protein WQ56_10935 [Luteimonas sp. FCS-9]|nr:hypothetical protein WQ56_10935 [Luteimonas sp. FCS-9]
MACALLALSAALPAAAQTRAPVENVDYVAIDGGTPWQPLDGHVEVVEVFSYGCIHCFHFQPMVDAWLARQPRDVRFSYLPAVFTAGDVFARGFFAAQALGIDRRTHAAVFDAVHKTGRLPRGGVDVDALAAFYAANGAPSQAAFKTAMTSPATEERLNAARAFALRSGLQGTPTLIINGRYRVQARTLEDTLAIADQLIARERVRP